MNVMKKRHTFLMVVMAQTEDMVLTTHMGMTAMASACTPMDVTIHMTHQDTTVGIMVLTMTQTTDTTIIITMTATKTRTIAMTIIMDIIMAPTRDTTTGQTTIIIMDRTTIIITMDIMMVPTMGMVIIMDRTTTTTMGQTMDIIIMRLTAITTTDLTIIITMAQTTLPIIVVIIIIMAGVMRRPNGQGITEATTLTTAPMTRITVVIQTSACPRKFVKFNVNGRQFHDDIFVMKKRTKKVN
jgi:hypothetical protein